MPKKISTVSAQSPKKDEKASDILEIIDSDKEKKSESSSQDKGAGDAPSVREKTSSESENLTESKDDKSISTSEEPVVPAKKKKNKKLSLRSKSSKKGKQCTLDDLEKTEVKDEKTDEERNIKKDSETPKRRSFFSLGKKTTTKSPKTDTPEDIVKQESKPKMKKNRLLTDFFPVRRSDRRSKAELDKIEMKMLEEKILSGCEDGLEVVDIEGKGRGVRATKTFKRNEFVVEYAGELITLTEAQAKEDHYSGNPDIGCYMYYFKHGNKNYCVDATAETGKLGRLLNHSKSGNCKTKVIGIGAQPYLILVAARDIVKGEELLYDYGDRSKEALEAHPWLAY